MHEELKKGTETVNKNFAYATLLREMLNLERETKNPDGTRALAAKGILASLKNNTGLVLKKHNSQFIFARASKGATLIAEQLGLVIKSPGDVPAHTVDFDASPRDIKLTQGGALLTARHQMQKNLASAEKLKAYSDYTGVGSKYSVVNGIEIQKFIPGDTLEEFMLERAQNYQSADQVLPEYLEKEIEYLCVSLLENAMTLEKFGLEQTDWSAGGFKVKDNLAMDLTAIDLGNVQPIDESSSSSETRLERVLNLKDSFHALKDYPEFSGLVTTAFEKSYKTLLGSEQMKNLIQGSVDENIKDSEEL